MNLDKDKVTHTLTSDTLPKLEGIVRYHEDIIRKK